MPGQELYSDLATRKPMTLLRIEGSTWLRLADRKYDALKSYQEPPRTMWNVVSLFRQTEPSFGAPM